MSLQFLRTSKSHYNWSNAVKTHIFANRVWFQVLWKICPIIAGHPKRSSYGFLCRRQTKIWIFCMYSACPWVTLTIIHSESNLFAPKYFKTCPWQSCCLRSPTCSPDVVTALSKHNRKIGTKLIMSWASQTKFAKKPTSKLTISLFPWWNFNDCSGLEEQLRSESQGLMSVRLPVKFCGRFSPKSHNCRDESQANVNQTREIVW